MVQPKFADDLEKFEFLEHKLYTAVVSDILDDLALKERVMHAHIRPVGADCVMVGRARTLLWMDVFEVYEHPYEIEIEAMDSLEPGDIPIHCTADSVRCAPWGALMTTAAKARGAKGTIADAYVRDVRQIIAVEFPVFAAGIRPLDSKGRGYVVRYDCPIECAGVHIRPRDLVFADYDGVVVVPQEAADDVVALAMQKVDKEKLSIKELREGRYLKDVYAKYGVL